MFFLATINIGSQIAAVPALAACNTAFGVCEAACVAALFAPTPWAPKSLRMISWHPDIGNYWNLIRKGLLSMYLENVKCIFIK